MMNARKSNLAKGADSRKSKSQSNQIHQDEVSVQPQSGMKRQGDSMLDPNQKRRPAFGDITNAITDKNVQMKKDKDLKKSRLPTKILEVTKVVNKTEKKKKEKSTKKKDPASENTITLSQDAVISSSQESVVSSSQESTSSSTSESDLNTTFTVDDGEIENVPETVDDVDRENRADIAQCAIYAPFIFRYYKERELQFMVPMYMDNQPSLTSNMRAILVDWLVEVQENFELNHETLYLAVKLVDTYLSKEKVAKENLQLVGAASLFVACKFDERCPPLVEDFLFICDDAYNRDQFLTMERSLLITIGFDIGMPLSYRFLRRYAKCARASMETLTLSRYILEMSLMEYKFIKYRESKQAAACLYLAMKMKNAGDWSETLEHYTGYKASDLLSFMKELNSMLISPPRQLNTIHSKYSHAVFYEVAKTAPLSEAELTSS
ncbi:hypothetical protein FSP39_018809 [Pinctada imbricata]|uniref:G2/mitotic-specific cyclin-B3 n=1 Tax=Pinctada imbricata TaxID=66713 RepID=A0AA88YB29_PINIB|nr:hypothetical protein FSP39_018809 [Pinctada imbricata]